MVRIAQDLTAVALQLTDSGAKKTAQAIEDYVVVRAKRPMWIGVVTFEED